MCCGESDGLRYGNKGTGVFEIQKRENTDGLASMEKGFGRVLAVVGGKSGQVIHSMVSYLSK